MKKNIYLIIALLVMLGCQAEKDLDSIDTENWLKRKIDISQKDSLEYGKSYLSVYSQIYSFSQHEKYNLTGMISLRNTSDVDTIYLLKTEYFDTQGALLRTYFDSPIYLAPMETTEIIIDQKDVAGGTGSNFMFEWKIPPTCPEPLFEGVMISMQGTQGLSFTTQAKRIR